MAAVAALPLLRCCGRRFRGRPVHAPPIAVGSRNFLLRSAGVVKIRWVAVAGLTIPVIVLTPVGLHSQFGDKSLGIRVRDELLYSAAL